MPVEAQTVSYTYIGDGSTTAFPFPSRILSAADIIVGVNGAIQTGVVVSGISDSGATVTLASAPAAGARVVLLRAPPFSQLVDFVNGQTVLEGTLDNALDKLTMMAQYLLLLVRGAVRVSELSGDTPPLIEAPLAPGRALIVNPAGDKLIAGPNAEDIAGAQGYAQQAEDARDLAEDYRDEAADWAAMARNDWVVQQFTGDGATVAFTLSADPGTVNNTFVTVDAVLQSKSAYTVAGTTLTFSEAPATGVPIEVAFGFRVTVGTPADGSITKPKLAAASVDETKLDTAPARVAAMRTALGIGYTLKKITPFTADGTWTPAAGTKLAILRTQGGGGGGGGASGSGDSGASAAAGGGGGGFSERWLTAGWGATEAVTIGAAGAAGEASGGGSGGSGGTTSIGTLCTASGGTGGTGATVRSTTVARGSQPPGGGGNGGGAGGTVLYSFARTGGNGGIGSIYSSTAVSGAGGDSAMSSGGQPRPETATGVVGSGYGAGGSGGAAANATDQAGGAGTIGYAEIIEYE